MQPPFEHVRLLPPADKPGIPFGNDPLFCGAAVGVTGGAAGGAAGGGATVATVVAGGAAGCGAGAAEVAGVASVFFKSQAVNDKAELRPNATMP